MHTVTLLYYLLSLFIIQEWEEYIRSVRGSKEGMISAL